MKETIRAMGMRGKSQQGEDERMWIMERLNHMEEEVVELQKEDGVALEKARKEVLDHKQGKPNHVEEQVGTCVFEEDCMVEHVEAVHHEEEVVMQPSMEGVL